jgi:replicative DNA helicase
MKMYTDVEAERTVLACAFLSQSAAIRVAAKCKPEWFTVPSLREIFNAVVSIVSRGQAPTRLLALDTMGGDDGKRLKLLVEISGTFPLVEDVNAYIGMIADAHWRRGLVERFKDAVKRLELGDNADEVERRVVTHLTKNRDALDEPDVFEQLDEYRQELQQRRIDPWARPTFPFREFADSLRFRGDGQLTVIGARTSGLKTQLCLQALNYMARHGHRVVYFSLEMSAAAIYERVAALEKGWDISFRSEDQSVSGGLVYVRDDDFQEWLGERRQIPLVVEDQVFTVQAIRLAILRHSMAKRVRLVCVDYLQNLSFPSRLAAHENASLSHAMRQFQRMGRELGVDFLLTSQFNRNYEKAKPKAKPTAAWLRGSGAIGEKADQIILAKEGTPDPGGWGVEYFFEKDRRHGQYGRHVPLLWDSKRRALKDYGYVED